jgi:hypothetical protein
VTVVDTTPPVVTVPIDITREATGPDGAEVTFTDVSGDDKVTKPIKTECVPPSGYVFPLGETTVTCSATDDADNTGENSFVVRVEDTTRPDVTVPEDITMEATGPEGA